MVMLGRGLLRGRIVKREFCLFGWMLGVFDLVSRLVALTGWRDSNLGSPLLCFWGFVAKGGIWELPSSTSWSSKEL